MSKPLQEFFTTLTVRNAVLCSLAAGSLLAGCVATVRVPGPPPPPVYAPPPPPAYAPPPPSDAAPVEVDAQATEAPPPLPEYEQPPCPEDGWMWTPGYWAYSTGGYYWIPGTWVAPPRVGVLWTPGYWGFVGGVYAFHVGYWGPHIGYYGGVNYGFGYGGVGFAGGRWVGNSFAYNTAVVHVNTTVIHNTYVNNVTVNNVTVNTVSYNGGSGGVAAAPTPQERAPPCPKPGVPPTSDQRQHVNEAVQQSAARGLGERRPSGNRRDRPPGSIQRSRGVVGGIERSVFRARRLAAAPGGAAGRMRSRPPTRYRPQAGGAPHPQAGGAPAARAAPPAPQSRAQGSDAQASAKEQGSRDASLTTGPELPDDVELTLSAGSAKCRAGTPIRQGFPRLREAFPTEWSAVPP